MLTDEYVIEWQYWVFAFLSAFILGFAKAGIKGLGVLVVTFMALAFESKISTGIVLTLLIFADILAVLYYRKTVVWSYIYKLLPWMIAGVLLGVYIGKDLPEEIFKKSMAVIILITVVIMFLFERRKDITVPNNNWFAGSMGFSAGFTTMIGNLAGAFSNIYFLAMRVPKFVFIGTTAWLFFFVNIFKMPFHIYVWETVSVATIPVFLRLIPGVLLGFIVGVKIIEKINESFFRKMILVLTALGAIMIFVK